MVDRDSFKDQNQQTTYVTKSENTDTNKSYHNRRVELKLEVDRQVTVQKCQVDGENRLNPA